MKTNHEYRGYVFTIDYHPKEPAFSVVFPDIPDIITSGDSLSEAFANACEALDLHLESLQKLGTNLPEPRHRLADAAGAPVVLPAGLLSDNDSFPKLPWQTQRSQPSRTKSYRRLRRLPGRGRGLAGGRPPVFCPCRERRHDGHLLGDRPADRGGRAAGKSPG